MIQAHNSFTIFTVRHTNHLYITETSGWVYKEVFDFFREQIFSATNDHILNSAFNFHKARIIHFCDVTRMHPDVLNQSLPEFCHGLPSNPTSPNSHVHTVHPIDRVAPLCHCSSTILISRCGWTRPTVPTRCSTESEVELCALTGAVSVIP